MDYHHETLPEKRITVAVFRKYAEIHGTAKAGAAETPREALGGQRAIEEIERRGYPTKKIGEVLATFLPKAPPIYFPRSLGILQQMEPADFERFLADRIRRDCQKDVALTKRSGDRGADIIVFQPNEAPDEILVVSAKQYGANSVHSGQLRELLKAMLYWDTHLGMLATASEIGGGVRDWIEILHQISRHTIRLVDNSNIHQPETWLRR